MKAIWYFIKRLFENLFWVTIILGGIYLFLSLCNWDLSLGGWNGFSRFLGGFIAGFILYFMFEAMRETVKNIRNKKMW